MEGLTSRMQGENVHREKGFSWVGLSRVLRVKKISRYQLRFLPDYSRLQPLHFGVFSSRP